MSGRDKVFKLFCQGFKPSSLEIKALGLSSSYRYDLHSEWKKFGKPERYPVKQRTKVAKPTAALHVTTPSGERIGGIDETKGRFIVEPEVSEEKPIEEEKGEEQEETEGTKETPGEEGSKAEEEKVRLPVITGEKPKEGTISADVVGLGIPISINISIKTLALFQIAASASGNSLDIGDFLDDCVTDYFRGRGLDLGLVKLNMGVKENAGG